MSHPSADIVRLHDHQLIDAGRVMGRAFLHEPLVNFIIDRAPERLADVTWYMRRHVDWGHYYGQIFVTSPTVKGASVWLPPGKTDLSLWQMIRLGLVGVPFKLGWNAFRRVMSVVEQYEAIRQRALPGPHWYLTNLGVDPDWQRQGIASQLMGPALAQIDAERLPCYVETAQPSVARFFTGFGFETVHEGDIAGGGPHFWAMVRPPAATGRD